MNYFFAIEQTIAVGVGHQRIGTKLELLGIAESVVIAIDDVWFGMCNIDFAIIRNPVVIAIPIVVKRIIQ